MEQKQFYNNSTKAKNIIKDKWEISNNSNNYYDNNWIVYLNKNPFSSISAPHRSCPILFNSVEIFDKQHDFYLESDTISLPESICKIKLKLLQQLEASCIIYQKETELSMAKDMVTPEKVDCILHY